MQVPIGEKLGSYQIIAPIGAGGMGEVYRARDGKLDRELALKVLPAAFAQDSERLARFEREAKVLAALNHPNIATIYGVAESDGVRALAMELVPGECLKGPVPIENALGYAKQIAEALEAAHEKGIVHRDLKPANIMVTPAGVVKVLDFGLSAMPARDGDASLDRHNSPTLTIASTQAGVILGTAAYMSPEQAAGKAADKRADIWSFGVVLWEMLTGQRLFDGETISETLADVLRAPIDFDKLPKDTPRPIRGLLRRCLDRNAKTRLRDIGEARIIIDNALTGARDATGVASAPVPNKRTLLPWVVAAILALAAAFLAFLHFREKPPELPALNATLLPPDGAEFDFGNPWAPPALSPDGARIVFGARPKDGKTQLWLRRLDSSAAQPLPGTERAEFPFWSPDSRWVAFGQDRKLKKIDIQGGPPVAVTDLPGPLRGGSWSAQGAIIFGANSAGGAHGIFRVAAGGGTATLATTLEPGKESRSHVFPWFLPDGRHFLYTRQQEGDLPIRVGSLDEPQKPGKIVAQSDSTVVYAMGHLLYLRGNTLTAQPFDPNRLETKGEAMPIAEGITSFMQPSRRAGITVSNTGLLVYQSGGRDVGGRIGWKDRQGKKTGNVGEPEGSIGQGRLSPDGKRLAAYILGSSSGNLWIYDVARGVPTRFTFDQGNDGYPVWSPDGAMLYFNSDRQGQLDLFRKASDGASEEQLLLSDAENKYPDAVSPDGHWLLYHRRDPANGLELWMLSLAHTESGKPEPKLYLEKKPFNELGGQFSPDGSWVAYQSDESGRMEVYASPFPGPGAKRQISSGGGFLPRWRRDGKELFYLTLDRELMSAEVKTGNGNLEVGRTQKLFDGPIANTDTFDVSADGQRFLVVDLAATSAAPLTLLQNWPAALRK
jgi:serine/threonine protein kinase